jgi:GNAT superfamily N-acetyltransferase
MTIRPATPADVPTILRFIRELATYEREPDSVLATEADLLRDGWDLAPDGVTPLSTNLSSRPDLAPNLSSRPERSAVERPAVTPPPVRFTALIADYGDAPAGFALYFTSYSTWRGHHGIRLEDLYVTPSLRGKGIGKALLAKLAAIAVEQGCPRLEWDVLDWNAPAIAIYEAIGAKILTEWHIMRLSGEALSHLADSAIGLAGMSKENELRSPHEEQD